MRNILLLSVLFVGQLSFAGKPGAEADRSRCRGTRCGSQSAITDGSLDISNGEAAKAIQLNKEVRALVGAVSSTRVIDCKYPDAKGVTFGASESEHDSIVVAFRAKIKCQASVATGEDGFHNSTQLTISGFATRMLVGEDVEPSNVLISVDRLEISSN